MSATATRTKKVDRNGNVSYLIHDADGIHLGDLHKTASGKYRPTLVNGDHGPDSTIKAGIEWLTTYAKPTAEEIQEKLTSITWYVETYYPDQIHDAAHVNRHARRLASLRTGQAEAAQTLARLTARLAEITEQSR